MHLIVGVLHTESQDASAFFERYLIDNREFFQVEDVATEEELRQWAGMADFESVELYAVTEGFEYDSFEDQWVRRSNPLGECDYFYLNEQGLTDYKGTEAGSMKIEHIDLTKPIPASYFVEAFAGEDELRMNSQEGESLEMAIIEAQRWEALNSGEDVVLTLVNMHC